ncbi:Radical SAM superfamily enzyme YgiQ, UPF0313 family [Geobacter sp. DSM 9736]|nr:Radical SAM superfamily enzyme YgiQ, UPF0313 family [Geobacter sp. DSM 9736]
MISTNRELAPQPVLPAGAALVAQALQVAGFQVRLLDLCFEKRPLRRIDDTLRTFGPDGIGISLRNLDNCDLLSPRSYLHEVKEVVDFLKSRTDAPVLIGGAGVSIMPRRVLEFLELDYAVAGEGEAAAVMFFQAGGAEERSRIPGVVCRREEAAPEAGEHLGRIGVMPRLHRWVDTKLYLRFEPVIPVQGKRGCANRCLYCTYPAIEGNRWRCRDPGEVAEEIEAAMAAGGMEFEFVDSVFNQPEGYMEMLLEKIIRSRIRARFHVSSLSPSGLTGSQVRLMERAGVVSVVITPEAASDATLAALRKGFTAAEVARAAFLLSGSGIRALWCFLLGGPEEDENTLAETIAFMNRKIPGKDRAFITTGIRIYPGTGMHETALREEVVSPAEDLLMPAFYFTPRLTLKQAQKMLRYGIEAQERCIFPSDTRLGPVGAFRRLGAALKLPTPFWRYSSSLNRLMQRSRVINRSW